MPVQYTPQFIPTNTQALQGVLSEYQQAYDKNLARELEVQDQYSMIPTITPQDTIKKNQILNQFGETMKGVEKKYNYDRASSAYSKELARKISDLRSQEFWSYNERKKEVAKLDQEMKARLGANYASKYDPLSATYEDQTAINKYAPKDLRDLVSVIGATAKEKATSTKQLVRNPIYIKNEVTGAMEPFVELGEKYGYDNDVDAADFLNNAEGRSWLEQGIDAAGFSEFKDNPYVMGLARQAAMQNLIGERKTSFSRMDNTVGTGTGRGTTTPSTMVNVGRTVSKGTIESSTIKNVRELEKQEQKQNISPDEEKRTSIEQANAIKNQVYETEDSQRTLENGKTILRSSLETTLKNKGIDFEEGEVDVLFDKVLDVYNTTATGKKILSTISGKDDEIVTILRDFLKEKGYPNKFMDNTLTNAKNISKSLNSWGNTEYNDIRRDINKKLKEGYQQEYNVYIPPVQEQSRSKEVLKFITDAVSVGAGQIPGQVSDIIDEKELAKFNAIPGDSGYAVLKANGQIPIIRLYKGGDARNSENVLDVTLKPEISGYDFWTELAIAVNDPELLSDAYFSGLRIKPNTTYGIGSDFNNMYDKQYQTYITDMMKSIPELKDKSNEDLSNKVNSNLKDINWKLIPNPETGVGEFHVYVKNNGGKEDITDPNNPITTVQDLMSKLTKIASL